MNSASRTATLQALHTARDQGLIRHWYAAQFTATTVEVLDFAAVDETWRADSSWFDLASLTKAMCTAPLALRAVADGRLALTFEVGDLFESARARGGRMLLWHLLCHCAGLKAYDHDLPAHAPLTSSEDRAQFVAQRLADWIQDAPGAATLYSDLGYVTLGVLLEAVYGGSLDRIFLRWSQRYCPELDLGFVSDDGSESSTSKTGLRHVVPNGPDATPPWQVHDPMAAHLGGVAGHAGLWGTGPAVVRWLQQLLTCTRDVIGAQASALYLAKPDFFPAATFTLGLDTADVPSTAGHRHPADAVGHLGFTGCSFWYSPSRAVGSVLLTDRAAQFPAGVLTDVPAANRAALFALRQAVHGACWD